MPTSLSPTPAPTATIQVGDTAATASQTPAAADPAGSTRINGPLAGSAAGLTALVILAIIWIRRRSRRTGGSSVSGEPSPAVAPKAEKEHGPNSGH
jgi:hypothetical protein